MPSELRFADFDTLPTFEQVAVALRCSRSNIETLVKKGELQVFRFGRRCVRIDPVSLQTYLKKQQAQSP